MRCPRFFLLTFKQYKHLNKHISNAEGMEMKEKEFLAQSEEFIFKIVNPYNIKLLDKKETRLNTFNSFNNF